MKPITITFEVHEVNGKKYFFIPCEKWQVLTNDGKNIVMGESFLSSLSQIGGGLLGTINNLNKE